MLPLQAAKILSAVFYGLASILIIYVNKIVLTTYAFPSFLVLGLGQMAATIVVIFIGNWLNITKIPPLSRDIPRRIYPLPLLYATNIVTGLGGTQRISLPMYTALRRFSILLTMIFEYVLLGVTASTAVKVSVGMMMGGASVAALNDLAFDLLGYTMIMINNLSSSANGVYMKQKLDAKDLGQYGLMFYNSLLMFPIMLLIAAYTGDLALALDYNNWTDPMFTFLFILSCICGFVLNYSIVLCTHYNSALTTACVGPIKNLFVTYGGMLFIDDYVFSMLNFIGINISVVGSILYTYVTFRQPKAQQQARQTAITVEPRIAPERLRSPMPGGKDEAEKEPLV